MENILLKISEASRTFNAGSKKVKVLDTIDLSVKEGEFISLMGVQCFHKRLIHQ